MRYISTRGESPAIGFLDAVLAGLAPDGGLYVPEVWPLLTKDEIAAFAGMSYAQVAAGHTSASARQRPLAAGTVPRPNPGVQGRRHADALAPV
jgi:hypothetical protein